MNRTFPRSLGFSDRILLGTFKVRRRGDAVHVSVVKAHGPFPYSWHLHHGEACPTYPFLDAIESHVTRTERGARRAGRRAARKYLKENHGSDRRAQEGARDPGAAAGATDGTGGGAQHAGAHPGAAGPGGSLISLQLSGVKLAASPFLSTSLTAFASGGPYADTEPKPPLEVVKDDMPILAKRQARLRFDGTGRGPFKALHHAERFDVDATAKHAGDIFARYFQRRSGQLLDPPHDAPGDHCTCGFYAVPLHAEPWAGIDPTTVTLLVELSGRVVEHELGYRAGHQRVVECQVPPCNYCGTQAEGLIVDEDGDVVRPVCHKHTPDVMREGQVFMDRDDLAGQIACSVTYEGTEPAACPTCEGDDYEEDE